MAAEHSQTAAGVLHSAAPGEYPHDPRFCHVCEGRIETKPVSERVQAWFDFGEVVERLVRLDPDITANPSVIRNGYKFTIERV